jgi:hypothetical protein
MACSPRRTSAACPWVPAGPFSNERRPGDGAPLLDVSARSGGSAKLMSISHGRMMTAPDRERDARRLIARGGKVNLHQHCAAMLGICLSPFVLRECESR